MFLRCKTSRFVNGQVKYLTMAALAAIACSAPASATVVDRPYFKASSIVIVFGADDFEENGGVAPVVYDFYLLDNLASGVAGNDIIGVDGRTINYNTRRYNPIQSGDASGWEFQVNDATFGGTFTSSAPHQTLDADDSYTAFGLDDDTDMDLLGGGKNLMFGNLIELQFGAGRNWPLGAALSLTLMVMVLVALIYYTKISSGEQKHHE